MKTFTGVSETSWVRYSCSTTGLSRAGMWRGWIIGAAFYQILPKLRPGGKSIFHVGDEIKGDRGGAAPCGFRWSWPTTLYLSKGRNKWPISWQPSVVRNAILRNVKRCLPIIEWCITPVPVAVQFYTQNLVIVVFIVPTPINTAHPSRASRANGTIHYRFFHNKGVCLSPLSQKTCDPLVVGTLV